MKIAQIYSLAALLAVGLFWNNPGNLVGQDATRVDLTPSQSTSTIYRIVSRLDGRGAVKPDQEQSINLRLDARFKYDERVIARKQLLKSVRDYSTARAEIRLGDGSIVNELPDDRQLIIAQMASPGHPVELAAIGGSITQQQFELINVPANTLTLGQLIAKSDVAVDDTWEPGTDDLARFLNIDTVEETDVKLKLEKIEKGIARIFVGGNASGRVDDAKTGITVSGSILFDIKAGFVRGSEISISQQRDISRLAPGLDARFKMIMRMATVESSPNLTDQGLAELRQQAGPIVDDFILTSKDGIVELTHSRDWRVIGQQTDRSILRFARDGQMLGQCDIISLPARPDDKTRTLDHFRQVVEAKLAEHKPTITSANQATTNSGLEWMRVTATGTSDGVQLIWTYYTIKNSDGQRVQLVFTTEPEQSAPFSRQFDSLISSIRFHEETPAQNASFQK